MANEKVISTQALIDAVNQLKPQPEPAKTYTLIISGLDRTQAEA